MDTVAPDIFALANWQFGILLAVATAVYLFVRGWQQPKEAYIRGMRLPRWVPFMVAMSLITLILGTPIHYLATKLFSIHVTQHILLMALIPCLINLSNPWPILREGVPLWVKAWLKAQVWNGRIQQSKAKIKEMTNPGVAFVLATVSFWIWYDPQIHNLTLQYRWVHTFETLLLLCVALLYWWHILGSEPHWHGRMPPLVRIIYTMVGTWPIKIVGLILLFSNQNLYAYPDAYQFSGLQINDQGVGAIMVWAIGGFVFSTTATLLARDWLGTEEVKPIDPSPAWQSDQGMRAPGFPSN